MVLLPSLSGELSDSPRKRGPVALGRARAACGREHAGPWQARSAARRCEGTSSQEPPQQRDRKSTRLNSSHGYISYAVFCLKKKKKKHTYVNAFTITAFVVLLMHSTSINMLALTVFIL